MRPYSGVEWCTKCGTLLTKKEQIMSDLCFRVRTLASYANASPKISRVGWDIGLWDLVYRRPEMIVPPFTEDNRHGIKASQADGG